MVPKDLTTVRHPYIVAYDKGKDLGENTDVPRKVDFPAQIVQLRIVASIKMYPTLSLLPVELEVITIMSHEADYRSDEVVSGG